MASKLNNSKAEDAFAQLLEEKYGLLEGWLNENGGIEGGHFVREHKFKRKFSSPPSRYASCGSPPSEFTIRPDFWFPQWRIVVELKAGPLGRNAATKEDADGYWKTLAAKCRPQREQQHASWSNQMSKFELVVQQSDSKVRVDEWCPSPRSEWVTTWREPEPETAGITWILVDDGQMSQGTQTSKKYTHRKEHQVNALRKTHRFGYGFNPMRANECGRFLWMYKEASELSGRTVCDRLHGAGSYGGLSVMSQVGWNVLTENTKRMILPELHTLDTFEGLHLVLGYEVLPDPEGRALADGEEEPEVGALVKASTVPFLVPPQKSPRRAGR